MKPDQPQGPRVGIYLDYENNRLTTRKNYGRRSGPNKLVPSFGNIHPLVFGHLIHNMGRVIDPTRRLVYLGLYRGMPVSPYGHPKVVRAAQRQRASWDALDGLDANYRALRYLRAENPDGSFYWKAEEKGIDVKLAADALKAIFSGRVDVVIIASADTDLIPVLEAGIEAGVRVETAGWARASEKWRAPLTTQGRDLWHHILTEDHFNQVRDDTDYSQP